MRILNIIHNAYRGTLEEQDDPAVWLTHAMKGAGADQAVLLSGNAVNYAVRDQDASGLSFGGLEQTQPPRLADDLAGLVEKGVDVFAVGEDIQELGIPAGQLLGCVEIVRRDRVASLCGDFDLVWRW